MDNRRLSFVYGIARDCAGEHDWIEVKDYDNPEHGIRFDIRDLRGMADCDARAAEREADQKRIRVLEEACRAAQTYILHYGDMAVEDEKEILGMIEAALLPDCQYPVSWEEGEPDG